MNELAEAFGRPPAHPADAELGAGVEATAYWTFGDRLEVVIARSEKLPSETQATNAWKKRLNRRPVPLVLLVADGAADAVLVGPSGDPPPAFRLDPQLVVADLKEAAELDALEVRRRLPIVWQRVRGAGGLTGLRNVGLFSTHYLKARVPRLPEWDALQEVGAAARSKRSFRDRLDALGLQAEEQAPGIFLVRAADRPAAAVLAYPAGQDFDRAAAGGELPVAGLIREMERTGTAWGILVSGEVWRLYSAEHPARATSFVEIDLARLGDATYFAALFSAKALESGGVAQTISTGSHDFAVALGDRLRERIYGSVVPKLVHAISVELERLGDAPRTSDELGAVYAATLTLLYRLLFVLYAESREYLPVLASAGYLEHSLRKRIDSVVATVESDREFDSSATDIWSDLLETFSAVANGHTEWGVPPYNGGLFRDDPRKPGGEILTRVMPTNAELGQALYDLAVDSDEVDAGRIDYSDLDIRHLGDIYEGLLQFEVDRAREPLRYDSGSDAYLPAAGGEKPEVDADDVYLRSRSGGRKASGSYYTPQIVVRHVVNEALVPAHDRHLEEVRALLNRGDEEGAGRLLWNFRVCDPAMGSGHFLVDALDVLTDRIATFLSEHPIAPVRAVLGQLRETVQGQARDLPLDA